MLRKVWWEEKTRTEVVGLGPQVTNPEEDPVDAPGRDSEGPRAVRVVDPVEEPP